MTNSVPPTASDKKSFWTSTRLGITFGVLALVAAFMLPSCQSDAAKPQPNSTAASNQPPAANRPAAPPAPVSSQPLPAAVLNTEMKDLDGKAFKLSDYAGKVVVINLWATWCGPCRVEIPELIKLSNEYKSRGVELIGITNEDPVEDAALVKDFVKKQEITYRVGWGDRNFELALMQGNVKNVIPQSFVITGDGRVIAHMTGFNATTTPQKLRAAVEQALNFKG
jgi:thiol-disulfide isomerase/thioredoxin